MPYYEVVVVPNSYDMIALRYYRSPINRKAHMKTECATKRGTGRRNDAMVLPRMLLAHHLRPLDRSIKSTLSLYRRATYRHYDNDHNNVENVTHK